MVFLWPLARFQLGANGPQNAFRIDHNRKTIVVGQQYLGGNSACKVASCSIPV